MKKIIITGAGSYLGKSLEMWLKQYPDLYQTETADMLNDIWKESDFSIYDTVFHVAGIVHTRETRKDKELFFKVNRDLTYEVAKKAKAAGVKQFIFMSSMSVYGLHRGMIKPDTVPSPNSLYGKSKLEAEDLLASLKENNFHIAIIRAPMVYGRGCKGNYQKLTALALKIPLFPDIKNNRSMLYINNLCEFVRLLIDDVSQGQFFPQNDEYVCTSELVRLIAGLNNRKIIMSKLFNPIIKASNISLINKLFGSLTYDKRMSEYSKDYCVAGFQKSVALTNTKLQM